MDHDSKYPPRIVFGTFTQYISAFPVELLRRRFDRDDRAGAADILVALASVYPGYSLVLPIAYLKP